MPFTSVYVVVGAFAVAAAAAMTPTVVGFYVAISQITGGRPWGSAAGIHLHPRPSHPAPDAAATAAYQSCTDRRITPILLATVSLDAAPS